MNTPAVSNPKASAGRIACMSTSPSTFMSPGCNASTIYSPVGETNLENCISDCSEERPELGRTPSPTEKMSLSTKPRKNTGVA